MFQATLDVGITQYSEGTLLGEEKAFLNTLTSFLPNALRLTKCPMFQTCRLLSLMSPYTAKKETPIIFSCYLQGWSKLVNHSCSLVGQSLS